MFFIIFQAKNEQRINVFCKRKAVSREILIFLSALGLTCEFRYLGCVSFDGGWMADGWTDGAKFFATS